MKVDRKIYKEQLSLLAEAMEKRHKVYMELEDFRLKNGYIPDEHIGTYASWLADGRRHWRQVPGVYRRIKQSAKRMALNVQNQKST
jgi:hypothetical protein